MEDRTIQGWKREMEEEAFFQDGLSGNLDSSAERIRATFARIDRKRQIGRWLILGSIAAGLLLAAAIVRWG